MSDKAVETTSNQAPQGNFVTHRIYIKGSNFEAPHLPGIFKEMLTPKIDLQVQTFCSEIEPKIYEAVLTLDITNVGEKEPKTNPNDKTPSATTPPTPGMSKDDKIIWRIQLKQAGIFGIDGFSKEQTEQALYGFCMNLLYPYACEAVSNMAVRSGFNPVYLIPMNFEALYMEQKLKANE